MSIGPKFIVTALSLFGWLVSPSAIAAKLQYDYVDVRYVDTEIDDTNIDGDGIQIGGSYRLNKEFYLLGDYQDIEFDFGIDASVLRLGGGYIYPFKKNVDLIGEAVFINTDIDVVGDENGFGLAFGGRGYVTPNVEVRATANYVDVDDDDTFFQVGAEYFINDSFSVGGSFTLGGDVDTFALGGRYYYR